MSLLRATEDTIIKTIENALQGKVTTVESLPGPLTLSTFRRLMAKAPAVGVAFIGSSRANRGEGASANARFDVFVAVEHGGNEAAGRRGDALAIGAYDILETICPRLNGLIVEDVGSIQFREAKNVFVEDSLNLGGAMYAASFAVPFDFETITPPDLGVFKTLNATWDLDRSQNGEPTATNTVTLPQE